MAEDTTKKGENNDQENKDWDWDATLPQPPADELDLKEIEPAGKTDDNQEEQEESEQVIETPVEAGGEEPVDDMGETPEGHCIVCGEKIRQSPSELYCNVCRERFLNTSYGARHIILSIAMVFVAVIGIVTFVSTSKIAAPILEGDAYVSANMLSNAADSYSSVQTTVDSLNDGLNAFLQGISSNFDVVDFFSVGTAANKKLAEINVKTVTSSYTDRENFIKLVESSFTEKELNSSKYKNVKECYDFCKAMDDTANDLYTTWNELYSSYAESIGEDGKITDDTAATVEDMLKYLDEYETENPKAEASTIEYYRFMSLYYDYSYRNIDNTAKMLESLKKAYDKAGKFNYFYSANYMGFAWESEDYDTLLEVAEETYKKNPANENAYYYAAKAYVVKKDYDSAIKTCENLKKYNPSSLEYYIIQAEVLRRKGDFDAALDVCKKGAEKAVDSEISRQEAIIYMLMGDKENALESAMHSYEVTYSSSYNSSGSVSLESLNTAALIAYLCDDKDTYEEIRKILNDESYDFNATVFAVVKGETTFEELFMSGKGDI